MKYKNMENKTILKTYESLQEEIHKRDYENIKGLKCVITEEQWNYFLNVLPPLNWINEFKENTFLLSECLTENLYLKFISIEDKKFFCEIVAYDLTEEEQGYY